MKKIVILVLFLIIFSICTSEERFLEDLNIVSVTHNGFSQNRITELNVTAYLNFSLYSEDTYIWIIPEDSFSNWTDYNDITEPLIIPASTFTTSFEGLYTATLNITTNNMPNCITNLKIYWGSVIDYGNALANGSEVLNQELEYTLRVCIDKSIPSSILTQTEMNYLATKYMPIMKFDGGSSDGFDEEHFYPKEVEMFLTNSSEIRNREYFNEVLSDASKENLAVYSESFDYSWEDLCFIPDNGNFINFRIPGLDEDEPNKYQVTEYFAENEDDYETKLYASICEEDDNIVITYHFFYIYNFPNEVASIFENYNWHFGDWEGMCLVFDKDDIISNPNTAIPRKASTSSHMNKGKRRLWENIETISNHPVVYVCNGSHATYFQSGSTENSSPVPSLDYHLGDGFWLLPTEFQGSSFDDGNNKFYSSDPVEILPRLDDIDTDNLENYWHMFGGTWGQSKFISTYRNNSRINIETTSPSGPVFAESKDTSRNNTNGFRWIKPYSWFEDQTWDTDIMLAKFEADETTGSAPFTVDFDNNSLGSITSYYWDFGDGSNSSLENPTHTYNDPGTYSVTLMVTDGTYSQISYEFDYITVNDFTATFTSLSSLSFPDLIVTNVKVQNNGIGVPDLEQYNFEIYEDGVMQTDLFTVIPPDESGGNRRADIVFVLDVTGSMGGEIESVRNNMLSFISALSDSDIDYRIGFVVFGDITYVYNDGFFYSNQTEILNIIQNINLGEHGIGYGGDGPENQLEAMADASTMAYGAGAQKIQILITDYSAHENDFVTSWTVTSLLSDILIPQNITVFPVFDTSSPQQLSQYVPIAEQTNPEDATYFDIYDSFNSILNSISAQVADTYVISYRPFNQSGAAISRDVRVEVTDGPFEAFDVASYVPYEAPFVQITEATGVVINQPQDPDGDLEFEVSILDNAEPYTQEVILNYKNTNESSYHQINMAAARDVIWSVTLPASQLTYPGLDFYITATDGVYTTSLPAEDPQSEPLQLALLPNQPPEITNFLPDSYHPGHEIEINATIFDTTNSVDSADLFYRKAGELIFNEVNMANSGGVFSATIPSDKVTDSGIEYYILAEDDLGVTGYCYYEGTGLITAENPMFIDEEFFDSVIVVNQLLPVQFEQTIDEPDSILFLIDAIDPDGNDLEYSWQLDGTEVSTTDTYLFQSQFFGDLSSENSPFNVTLDVTDNYGEGYRSSLSYSWTVNVNNTNHDPVAVAGEDITVDEQEFVTLTGSDSYDEDGDIETYLWTSPPEIELSNNNIADPTFTAPVVEEDTEYLLTLSVTDACGGNDLDTLIVTVRYSNYPPEIIHQPLTVIDFNEPLLIEAEVIDDFDALDLVRIYYRYIGTQNFQIMQMTEQYPAHYFCTLNIDEAYGAGIEYFVNAVDDVGKQAFHGTPDNPHVVISENIPAPINISAVFDDLSGELTLSWEHVYTSRLSISADSGIQKSAQRDFLTFRIFCDGDEVGSTSQYEFSEIIPDYGFYNYQVIASYDEGESLPGEPIYINWYSGEDHFIPVSSSGPGYNNMVINVVSASISDIALEPGDEIAVFDGELCVGARKMLDGSENPLTLTAAKDDPLTLDVIDGFTEGDQLSFKFWDAGTGVERPSVLAEITYGPESFTENSENYVILTWMNHYPIADAGDDFSVDEGTLAYLDGSGSYDPDEYNSLTYSWTAPAGFILSDNTEMSPSFIAPDVSVDTEYIIELEVSDNVLRYTDTDEVIVTVFFVNHPPFANAGSDQTVTENDLVQLDASATYDEEGDPVTYQWIAPDEIILSDPNSVDPTFTAPEIPTNTPVDFEILLYVDDGIVDRTVSEPDTVVITILNINQAPIADAGYNFTVNELQNVQLNGCNSHDPDDDDLEYFWSSPEGITLTDPHACDPAFTAPEVFTNQTVSYDFVLVVDDGLSVRVESLPDTVTIFVSNINEAPIADAGEDQNVMELDVVTLDGSGSYDPEGDEFTYTWSGPANVSLSDVHSVNPTFSAPEVISNNPVIYNFVLRVNDHISGRLISDPDTVRVFIHNYNHAPVADAGDPQEVDESDIVQLDGSGSSDTDFDDLSFTWYAPEEIELSDQYAEMPTFTAPQIPTNEPVEYQIVLIVDDGIDQRVTSLPDTVVITVNNINQQPVANAGEDQEVIEMEIVSLNGTGSHDPDQDELIFSWESPAGIELSDPNNSQPQFTAPEVETEEIMELTFVLTVSESNRLSDEDEVTIFITHYIEPDPTCAIDPLPQDGASQVNVASNFGWTYAQDPEYSQPEGFRIYMADNEELNNAFETYINFSGEGNYLFEHPTELEYETDYYWQVVPTTENTRGDATDCPVWHFITEDMPVYSVSGNVDVTAVTSLGNEIYTNAQGNFDISVYIHDDLTLTPELDGFDFEPQTVTFEDICEDVEFNFSAEQWCPNAPQNGLPQGNDVFVDCDEISWEAASEGVIPNMYQITMALHQSYFNPIINNGETEDTFYPLYEIELEYEQTYYVRVYATYVPEVFGYDGMMSDPLEWSFTIEDEVGEDEDLIPLETTLFANHPNPFNPVTTIEYHLAEKDNILINIYNLKGQCVKTLVNDELSAGKYSVKWEGDSDSGEIVPSGVYLYQLKTDNFIEIKKMILLK